MINDVLEKRVHDTNTWWPRRAGLGSEGAHAPSRVSVVHSLLQYVIYHNFLVQQEFTNAVRGMDSSWTEGIGEGCQKTWENWAAMVEEMKGVRNYMAMSRSWPEIKHEYLDTQGNIHVPDNLDWLFLYNFLRQRRMRALSAAANKAPVVPSKQQGLKASMSKKGSPINSLIVYNSIAFKFLLMSFW